MQTSCVLALAGVMAEQTAYLGLFASAFAAATLLPAQSETVLAALLLTESYSAWLLIAVASVGDVFGSTLNWFIGRGVERFRDRRWFPASQQSPWALAPMSRWRAPPSRRQRPMYAIGPKPSAR